MEKFRLFIEKIPTGILSGCTVAVILWLTLAPHPTGDLEVPLFPGADKVVHALMFGFLTFILLLELMRHRGWTFLPLPAIGLVAFASAIFGIVIEVVQAAMGLGRSFEILDIMADSAGSFAMGGVWAVFQKFLAKPED